MRYLIFVKSEYTRDSQAFTGMAIEDEEDIYMSWEKESGWQDAEGDILVADIECASDKEAFERISRIYPEAENKIFRIMKTENMEEIEYE